MNVRDLNADLTSHHIEGIAHMGHTPFSVPLISLVSYFGDYDAELWQGGCRDGVPLEGFAAVVSLYPWERYRTPPETARIEIALYDAAGVVPDADIDWAADQVARFLDRGNVLVHCQAGLNRSSLVVASYLKRHRGMSGPEAVDLIRETRSPACLCNPTFEEWALS